LNTPTLSRPPLVYSNRAAARVFTPEPCAVLALDPAGRVTAANSSARALWQTGDRELVGEHFASLIQFEVLSDEPEWLEAQWAVLLANALDKSAPLAVQPREGAPRDALVRIEKNLGPSAGYVVTVQPPSATEILAEDESTVAFRLLAEKGAVGFFDLHLKAGRVRFSPAWKKILGYKDDELPDTLEIWHKLIHADDSAASPDKIGKKFTVGARPFNVEFRMYHRLEHWVWVQCVGLQMISPAGEVERVIGFQLDITERKELEEASVVNDARLQDLSDSGPLGAFELDFAGNAFWFSTAWRKILGYTGSAFTHDLASLGRVLPETEVVTDPGAWLLSLSPEKNELLECVTLRAENGSPVPVLLGLHRTLNRKRELMRAVGFICALPDSLCGAAAPGAVPATLATEALNVLSEAVLAVNPEGAVVFANAAALRLLRLVPEQLLQHPASEVFRLVNRQSGHPSGDPRERARTADSPLPLISDDALVSLSGEASMPVVWTARAARGPDGKPRGVVIVFRNPDEMNLTPEELVRANRFESLGVLAGGIAHDFNNLLATILGSLSLAKDSHDYALLDDAEAACLNAKGLAKQLLAVAKGGGGAQSTVIPAREILEDSVKIAGAGAAAVITVAVAEGTGGILADRAQILQVFQNLVLNALQAMPPPPHPARIEVRAQNVTLKEKKVPPLPAGEYVEFEVRDNGSGIKPEHRKKIFDAFFTTKKHGTGLGLATVISIVRKHGGQIGLDTQEGVGTAFTVYLPRAEQEAELQARKAPSLRFGTGRILFMDDDARISELTGTMLGSLDYKYDLAKNGEEAIALYQRYLNIGRPYDVVIMDITVIGGMGGEEAFKALRKIDPDVRAIVSSGYDNDDMARRFLDMGFCGYLTKPYRVIDLGKILKTVLG
jgi:two-component system, cell cycle sensor histidine kinase and response regulator CckA